MHISSYYTSQEHETTSQKLQIVGIVPKWLNGKLIRNGPALFEVGKTQLRHWFDGYGLLHSFDIRDGEVSYQSRYIQSEEYLSTHANTKDTVLTWGTAIDPCLSLFGKLMTIFSPSVPNNTSVAVAKIGDRYFTTSDIPVLNEFDPETLETLSTRILLRKGIVAAHPIFLRDGSIWNMESTFGPVCSNRIISIDTNQEKKIWSTFVTKKSFYSHAFANTDRYFIVIEQPMYLDFWKLVTSAFRNLSYYECFSWDYTATNIFHIYDRETGIQSKIQTDLSFFFFHTINASEKDGILSIDLCGYTNNGIIDDLYLEKLRTSFINPAHRVSFYHLQVNLQDKTVSLKDGGVNIELPSIDISKSGTEYRYVYGIYQTEGSFSLADAIIKYDVRDETELVWKEDGIYPGEPIFVPNPTRDPAQEDDGVLVIICFEDKISKSFLLILDARTLLEISRTYTPNYIPAGLHGHFYSEHTQERVKK